MNVQVHGMAIEKRYSANGRAAELQGAYAGRTRNAEEERERGRERERERERGGVVRCR